MLILPGFILAFYALYTEGQRETVTTITPVQKVIEGCAYSTINYHYTPFFVSVEDLRIMGSAQKRCKVHYPLSVCLKRLDKRSENNDYQATCGPKEEK